MIRTWALSTLLAVAFVASAPLDPSRQRLSVRQLDGEVLPGHYIVKLKENDDTSPKRIDDHITNLPFLFSASDDNSPITHEYNSTLFSGYAGSFTDEQLDAILNSPDVEFVEENGV